MRLHPTGAESKCVVTDVHAAHPRRCLDIHKDYMHYSRDMAAAKVAKKKADRGIGGPIGTQMDVFPFSPDGWFRMDCNSAVLAGRSPCDALDDGHPTRQ